MADTMRGAFPGVPCDDCGEKECCYRHWGPLVPPGKIMTFCDKCWQVRILVYLASGDVPNN